MSSPSKIHPALDLFQSLEPLTKVMLDAYVIVDNQGKVLKNNQSFSVITKKSSKFMQRAESMDEFMALSIANQPLPITELLRRRNPDRLDEIHASIDTEQDLILIIGYYPIIDPKTDLLEGAFLLIRDVTAEAGLQTRFESSEKRATTDPLTGLHTRGFFENQLNVQVQDLLRKHRTNQRQNLSIAILDIDFFKKVNDVYGHQAGDHVLKITAKIMQDSFRKSDILCRYGGEEFLVIFQETTLEHALRPLEKFRTLIEKEQIQFEGHSFSITVSSGVAQFDVANETYEQTIGRADKALYASKENGRNQVTAHTGESIKPASEILS